LELYQFRAFASVVQQLGTPAGLYDYPANGFVAGFVGTMNLPPARVRRRQARSLTLQLDGIGELDWPADADTPAAEWLMVSFRPHSLCVDAADAARDARYLWLTGVVEASEFLGEPCATACAWAATPSASTSRTAPAWPRTRRAAPSAWGWTARRCACWCTDGLQQRTARRGQAAARLGDSRRMTDPKLTAFAAPGGCSAPCGRPGGR
jgi:hypothetical protein